LPLTVRKTTTRVTLLHQLTILPRTETAPHRHPFCCPLISSHNKAIQEHCPSICFDQSSAIQPGFSSGSADVRSSVLLCLNEPRLQLKACSKCAVHTVPGKLDRVFSPLVKSTPELLLLCGNTNIVVLIYKGNKIRNIADILTSYQGAVANERVERTAYRSKPDLFGGEDRGPLPHRYHSYDTHFGPLP
jgi:hypothetical protein